MILAVIIGFVGLFTLYLEFFLPGGILALLGFVILVSSVVLFCLQADSGLFATLYAFFLLVASFLVCLLALKSIRRSGKYDSFFLKKDQTGFSVDKIEEDLIGKEGVVTTELKPAGHVRIEKKLYQAVSIGQFLPKDTVIEVIQMKGASVVVKSKL